MGEASDSSAAKGEIPSKDEIKREIKQEIAEAIQHPPKSPSASEKPAASRDKSPSPKADTSKKEKKPFHWTGLKIAAVAVLLLVIGIFTIRSLHHAWTHEETDDAYLVGYIHQISSRVTGNVESLEIVDNQFVQKGQILLQLDPRDYLVELAKAQANFDKAKADFDRVETLKDDVAISKQDYDQTKTTLEVAKASLDDAHNQLDYCTITSPTYGYIGNRTVNVGDRVVVGGALMAVVQDIWVVANFKETQLAKMKKNQSVEVIVDAFPEHKFHGHVDSFSPGTGAVFALLPSDNATGNFTKIVQRIPVKILLDPASIRGYENRLTPGLSVEASVNLDQNIQPSGDQSNQAGQ